MRATLSLLAVFAVLVGSYASEKDTSSGKENEVIEKGPHKAVEKNLKNDISPPPKEGSASSAGSADVGLVKKPKTKKSPSAQRRQSFASRYTHKRRSKSCLCSCPCSSRRPKYTCGRYGKPIKLGRKPYRTRHRGKSSADAERGLISTSTTISSTASPESSTDSTSSSTFTTTTSTTTATITRIGAIPSEAPRNDTGGRTSEKPMVADNFTQSETRTRVNSSAEERGANTTRADSEVPVSILNEPGLNSTVRTGEELTDTSLTPAQGESAVNTSTDDLHANAKHTDAIGLNLTHSHSELNDTASSMDANATLTDATDPDTQLNSKVNSTEATTNLANGTTIIGSPPTESANSSTAELASINRTTGDENTTKPDASLRAENNSSGETTATTVDNTSTSSTTTLTSASEQNASAQAVDTAAKKDKKEKSKVKTKERKKKPKEEEDKDKKKKEKEKKEEDKDNKEKEKEKKEEDKDEKEKEREAQEELSNVIDENVSRATPFNVIGFGIREGFT